jgi:hypothetical protein
MLIGRLTCSVCGKVFENGDITRGDFHPCHECREKEVEKEWLAFVEPRRKMTVEQRIELIEREKFDDARRPRWVKDE